MIQRRLAERGAAGNPIKIGIVGAGPFGMSLINQVAGISGMVVNVVADYKPELGIAAFVKAGRSPDDIVVVETASAARDAVARGKSVVVPSGDLVPGCDIEVVFDATGYPESAASVGYRALLAGRHLVSANAEGDCCVGAILSRTARANGATYNLTLGDQPGNAKDLFDYATTLGLCVVCAGKGATIGDEERARERLANLKEPELADRNLIGALDGSKEHIEAASLANLIGYPCDVNGLHEPVGTLPRIVNTLVPKADGGILSESGLVDVAVCNPPTEAYPQQWKQLDVFVIVTSDNANTRQVFHRKGVPRSDDGRYTLLARPWHAIGVEAPLAIARAVLDNDRFATPRDTPVVEVVAVAKRALRAG